MSEFDDCLKKRGIVRFEGSPDVVARESEAAHQDLDDAGLMLEHQQWKRLTITAYYCMFHSARALILRAGYAEKSHFCLGVAFRELYADTPDGLELAMGLERARVLRENADYRSDFDEAGARAALVVAERFVRFADDVLGLRRLGR
jgi:hypothetical protein